jgi:hypothetical protein
MKRPTLLLLSCFVLAGGGWMAHSVWGQAAAPAPVAGAEKTFTITQSQLDKYVADKVAAALAEREKSGHSAGGPVSDEQVLKSENWHRAVYNHAEYVVYTGPGQAIFHHFPEPTKLPPARGVGPATTPPPGK